MKTKKKVTIVKLLALTMCILMLCSFAVACTKDEPSQSTPAKKDTTEKKDITEAAEPEVVEADPITIEFFQQKGEEGPQKGYQMVIDNFAVEYPHITIEMNTVPDPGKVLVSRIASDDLPPLFSDYPTQMQFKEKVENGFIEKLSGQELLSRINPAAIAMSVANDGETYAVPLSNNYYGVYYNIDIFEENGFEVPTTYADFIALCQTMVDLDMVPIGTAAKGNMAHIYQCMNVAWIDQGFEKILEVAAGEATLSGDPDYIDFGEKLLEVFSFSNEDTLGMDNGAMWENFANGKYPMALAGSYARGTILIANPDLNMGIFPLPNDTLEDTKILTGVDAALCISAMASDEEKDAGLKFLDFLTRGEQAQIFCDADGAPSCVVEVEYKNLGAKPVVDMIANGQIHDWAKAIVPGTISTDVYNLSQGVLIDKDVAKLLTDTDESIKINAAD